MKTPARHWLDSGLTWTRIARGVRHVGAGLRPAQTIILLALCFLLSASVAYSQASEPDAEVVQTDYLNLRAAPTTTSDVLGVLPPGAALRVVGMTADRVWLQVETSAGQLGWVYAQYLVVHIDLDTAFPDGSASLRLPDDVAAHVRQVYAVGQARGNRANVFAKVGDSITVSILFLNPIGDGLYDLGDYSGLRGVIDFYSQAETRDGDNSFNETPIAARIGWTTYGVLDPDEADSAVCSAGESSLLCEYRVLQPSVAIIMFGTNDVGILSADNYRSNLDRIVTLSESWGVIPILSTIPPREGYESRVQEFNRIVFSVAALHSVPVVDYGGAMQSLGLGGLDQDHVHPSPSPRGYEGAADFREENLHYGYVIRNLTALQMLDAVWRATQNPN